MGRAAYGPGRRSQPGCLLRSEKVAYGRIQTEDPAGDKEIDSINVEHV
jgi:hypothetical protein